MVAYLNGFFCWQGSLREEASLPEEAQVLNTCEYRSSTGIIDASVSSISRYEGWEVHHLEEA